MFLFDITQQSMEAALKGSGLRSQAINQNLANVNTPGYRRVDVSFQDALAAKVAQAKQTGETITTPFAAAATDESPVRIDGNAVDVDAENAMAAENALLYQGLTQLLGSRRRLFEQAMRTQGV